MTVLPAEKFWKNVKSELKEKGFTQKYMCIQCGLNEGSFKNRVSKGVYPSIDEVILIAKFLEVSIDKLTEINSDSIPTEVIDIAYEIIALPDVYRKIVFDTVRTLRDDYTERAREELQNSG